MEEYRIIAYNAANLAHVGADQVSLIARLRIGTSQVHSSVTTRDSTESVFLKLFKRRICRISRSSVMPWVIAQLVGKISDGLKAQLDAGIVTESFVRIVDTLRLGRIDALPVVSLTLDRSETTVSSVTLLPRFLENVIERRQS
jgi:hypothetical protein